MIIAYILYEYSYVFIRSLMFGAQTTVLLGGSTEEQKIYILHMPHPFPFVGAGGVLSFGGADNIAALTRNKISKGFEGRLYLVRSLRPRLYSYTPYSTVLQREPYLT